MLGTTESFFGCPYCGETISMILESGYGNQKYIEDCEVCCRPIEVDYQVVDGDIFLSNIKTLND